MRTATSVAAMVLPAASAFTRGVPSIVQAASSLRHARSFAATPLRLGVAAGDVFHAEGLTNGMKYVKLGSSDLVVSEVCLGTMTWGEQNNEDDASAQLDLAVDEFGINFIDTAELYPVPAKAETSGRTDKAIAKWLKGRKREDIVLASKVAGRAAHLGHLRSSGEPTRVRKADIIESVDKSLQRLGTDYLDLLQVHWPDRYVPLFGGGIYDYEQERSDDIPFEEQLQALEEVIKAGKVRNIGLSNETPYGVMKFVTLAEQLGLPRVCSIQNSYSLLVRADFELGGLVEVCAPRNSNVGLLAYSPLAGGVLTGKYQDPNYDDSKSRLSFFKGYMGRYRNSFSEAAVKEYMQVAQEAGLTPTQLALAWCYTRPYVTSTIVGATTCDQLRENIMAYNCPITEETTKAIQQVYRKYTDPTKSM
eukprot:TRINITY_DN643_c2_g1_i4.p1 TRINITY_DN643_c2_g1~~TRINITY_DN643_c2_g1_i4.p1  ORF type:complete len:419 (-),score=75.55 TRINITY_DN643_c2_g1_i4:183-1439(-)